MVKLIYMVYFILDFAPRFHCAPVLAVSPSPSYGSVNIIVIEQTNIKFTKPLQEHTNNNFMICFVYKLLKWIELFRCKV